MNKYLEKIAAKFEEDKYEVPLEKHHGNLVLNHNEYKGLNQKAFDNTPFKKGRAAVGALTGGALGALIGSFAGKPGAILGGLYGATVGGVSHFAKETQKTKLEEANKIYEGLGKKS